MTEALSELGPASRPDARWPPPGGVPTVVTARVTLRAFHDRDAARVATYAGDRRIADGTLAIPHPYPAPLARTWIASLPKQWADGEGPTWAIADREDGVIGAVGLRIWTAHALAEVGYWIGVPWWRQGYATEAVTAALRWGFTRGDVARVFARCFSGNDASSALLERLGFAYEGMQHSHFVRLGTRRDVRLYGLLAEAWRAHDQAGSGTADGAADGTADGTADRAGDDRGGANAVVDQ